MGMSPVGSDYSLDLKSPTSSQCFSPVPRLEAVSEGPETASAFEKTYESLKSTCSSQNSSKASSTASSSAASSADLSTYKLRLMEAASTPSTSKQCNVVPDTEDPNLIKSLNFVSPKSGVYRPMPEGSRR